MHRIEEFTNGAIVFGSFRDPIKGFPIQEILRVRHCWHTVIENCQMFGHQHWLERFGTAMPLDPDHVEILCGVEILPRDAGGHVQV